MSGPQIRLGNSDDPSPEAGHLLPVVGKCEAEAGQESPFRDWGDDTKAET